jgi:ATP-dependent Lhr-like helicase
MLTPQEVKSHIPHTWPLFFRQHGRFTPIQQKAIVPIRDGSDILAIAATASGKTEAIVAPLVERYWDSLRQAGLTILYICPTRALVRDLYERIQPILAQADISVGMKTGDTKGVNAKRPSSILLTTPESTDSLLTRVPKLFIGLKAIVLDEIHLFDNTPRGDHLRCLLPRIERIRQYANPATKPMQRVALSATIPDPAGVAKRYLHDGVIVNVEGSRELVAEVLPLYDLTELVNALAQRASQKSLLFCNSRSEVEQTAVYLRQHLPHHAEIFVHYSNLDGKMRQDVETRFAAAAVAVCVTTATLELGIDIGSVDDVVLLGAPYTLTSFLQRIGRGGRRTAHTRVLCMPKSPSEWARFEALIALASGKSASDKFASEKELATRHSPLATPTSVGFRPSVLVQQIFSMMKQSPVGTIRLADVRRIAPASVTSEDIRQIVAQLSFTDYLKSGRLGEWKSAAELDELLDRHEIYSNIGGELLASTAVDAYTGKVLAQTEHMADKGTVVLFGGKPMVVVWRDRYRFGLAPTNQVDVDEVLRFRKSYPAIPFNVTQAVARSLDIEPGQMVFLPDAEGNGMTLFHFWGTVWGALLTAVLRAHQILANVINEYCLHLRPAISQLPKWDDGLGQEAAKSMVDTAVKWLQMGRFHQLLSPNVGETAVIQQLNLPQFSQHYQTTTLIKKSQLNEQLQMLMQ